MPCRLITSDARIVIGCPGDASPPINITPLARSFSILEKLLRSGDPAVTEWITTEAEFTLMVEDCGPFGTPRSSLPDMHLGSNVRVELEPGEGAPVIRIEGKVTRIVVSGEHDSIQTQAIFICGTRRVG